MVNPNTFTSDFCDWLLNSGYQNFPNTRRALIQLVKDAADAGTSVTDQEWNDFTRVCAQYYTAYAVSVQLSNGSPFFYNSYSFFIC